MSKIKKEIIQLQKRVWRANLLLPWHDLVKFTWGNVSEKHPTLHLIAIKPSGVEYENLTYKDIVILDSKGKVIEGALRPSSDTPTHLELYDTYADIGGIVHTHAPWSTAWSQAGNELKCYGTTHSDYFYGAIPCTRVLTKAEVRSDYEQNTGKVIVETLQKCAVDPLQVPAIFVRNHGPFTWGHDAIEAVHNMVVLEEVSKLAYHTLQLHAHARTTPQYVLDKHYTRKHGDTAYYGQEKK